MVLTLKVVSSAINYQDGLLKEEDLRPAQKKYRVVRLPSVDEYVGFCFCCGTHLAGPVYEIRDYLDWTADEGVRKKLYQITFLIKSTTIFSHQLICYPFCRYGVHLRSLRLLMEEHLELFYKLFYVWGSTHP